MSYNNKCIENGYTIKSKLIILDYFKRISLIQIDGFFKNNCYQTIFLFFFFMFIIIKNDR